MLLPLIGTSLERPKSVVIILRSLRQASRPSFDDEKSWWASLNGSVDAVFVFSPNVDSFLAAYTSGPQGGLPDAATGLLQELSAKPWINTCSIVFFAHSFGGIILKQAMVLAYDHPDFRQVIDSTAGVIFLGTAHDGNSPGFNKALRVSAGVELECSHRNSILRQLVSDRSLGEIRDLCNQFQSLSSNLSYDICSFYEERETPYRTRFSTKQMLVISSSLARLQLGRSGPRQRQETAIGLDMNHDGLSSYIVSDQTLKEQLFQIVANFLSTATVQPPLLLTSALPEMQIQQESPNHVLEIFRTAAPRPKPPIQSTATSQPEASPKPIRLPCHIIYPYQRNPAFTGRSDILEAMTSALTPGVKLRQEQKKIAVVGMGGIGKTQIAVEYAFRSVQDFPVILWAHAETRAKLSQSYSEFDRELGLSSTATQNENESRRRVKSWLATTNVNWLMVLDNVEDKTNEDDESLLTDFWPTGDRGSVLVTTRNEASLGQFTGGEIKTIAKLADDDGADLLLRLSGRPDNTINRRDAQAICSRIEFLPLAISSVAALLKSTKLGLDDYLVEYTNSDLIRKSKPLSGPEAHYLFSLATAWQSQFTHLDQDSPGSRSFLNILALLDPDGIREEFLLEGVQKTKHPKLPSLLNVRKFRGSLTVMDLIYRNADMKKIWMHRLMQGICQVTMVDTNTYQEAFDCAFDLINTIWPVPDRHNRQNGSFWPRQQELVPHVESLAEHYREFHQRDRTGEASSGDNFSLKASRAFAELLYNAGWYFYERGNFRSSYALLNTAEQYCIAHPDGAEAILADINGAYASIYSESNNQEGCRKHFELQLKYCLEAIEKGQIQRPNVREALAYGGMGTAKMMQKEYAEAEKNYRRCMEIWKECPGEPSIYTKHLAESLSFQGYTDEAEKLLLAWIEERAEKFGPKDTTSYRTGILYKALGSNQIRQGKLDAAYQSQLDAAEMHRTVFGGDHHLIADTWYKAGWLLARKGECEKAKDHLFEALRIYEKGEGAHRNEMARTYFQLGELYTSAGDAEAGREWNDKAETLRRRILGREDLPPGKEDDYDQLIMFWSL
ncbi:hypothetical protein GGR52DRAFT_67803 [Hypoxylon sp. FL1284]|nr:hypothetical protein GGR52DRAFT_67803 [Hypoxylon sp. FL1284]